MDKIRLDPKSCVRCKIGRMYYDQIDECYTCMMCGSLDYPELVSVRSIAETYGIEEPDLVQKLRQMQEPIRQGMVHERAIKRLAIREKKNAS